ncbi:hypothetical protein HALDL1_03805 [Halobacterium sp. DL1]|nr:hypothetical protein HALDL1_03805 [Halobacterium sp. DL1]
MIYFPIIYERFRGIFQFLNFLFNRFLFDHRGDRPPKSTNICDYKHVDSQLFQKVFE